MFKKFKSTLLLYNRPFILLSGDENERFNTAVTAIDELLNPKN
jgi:nicotinamide riboside kinase